MTKRELVERLAEFPDDVDVMYRDWGSDQYLYVNLEQITFITNTDDEYYNTILVK